METCPGEQHGHAGCWDESVGVCRQDSSSRICFESLKEEGDLLESGVSKQGRTTLVMRVQ